MKLNIKRPAFTLVEIMLTISLIGFLATLTLSTIGSSVQQRARLSQFRTAHSKMSAVLRSITSEDGQMYQCYLLPSNDEIEEFGLNIADDTPQSNNTGCRTLTDRFVRAMGATKICEGSVIDQGCLPENYPVLDGSCFSSYDNNGAYVLDNGMIIITDNDGINLKLFAVDVNGRKGPNKWGQDIFLYSIKATESVNSRGNVFVTQLGILAGDYPGSSCSYDLRSSTKSSIQMMRESAGFKAKKTKTTNWKDSGEEDDNNNTLPDAFQGPVSHK